VHAAERTVLAERLLGSAEKAGERMATEVDGWTCLQNG